jgi:hypothetical protein
MMSAHGNLGEGEMNAAIWVFFVDVLETREKLAFLYRLASMIGAASRLFPMARDQIFAITHACFVQRPFKRVLRGQI